MAYGNPKWGKCQNGGVFLHLPTPLDPQVVLAIRNRIPKTRCRWNDLRQVWWVHDNWIFEVENILKSSYPAYDPYEGV